MFKKLFLSGLCLAVSSSSLLAMQDDLNNDEKRQLAVSLNDDKDYLPQNRQVRATIVYGPAEVIYSNPIQEENCKIRKFDFEINSETAKSHQNGLLYLRFDIQNDLNKEMTASSDTYYSTSIHEVNYFNNEKVLNKISMGCDNNEILRLFEIKETVYN